MLHTNTRKRVVCQTLTGDKKAWLHKRSVRTKQKRFCTSYFSDLQSKNPPHLPSEKCIARTPKDHLKDRVFAVLMRMEREDPFMVRKRIENSLQLWVIEDKEVSSPFSKYKIDWVWNVTTIKRSDFSPLFDGGEWALHFVRRMSTFREENELYISSGK